MSALAEYCLRNGAAVAGYDAVSSTISVSLASKGALVFHEDSAALLPEAFEDASKTTVVYTPAIPESSLWFQYFKSRGFKMIKRAVLLGALTADSFCYAVAGTHGKTTTTALLAHLLDASGLAITAFLGGVAHNFEGNLLSKGMDTTVVEADEFDRSFLQLSPNVACITSTDADHLDIYKSAEALEESFVSFSELLPHPSTLFVHEDLQIEGVSYGEKSSSDYYYSGLEMIAGKTYAKLHTPSETFEKVLFPLPGKHNVLNTLVAFAMAYSQGVPPQLLIKALAGFKGIARRFSYELNTDERVYIDDYAHHPTAIKAMHNTLREQYPDREITLVFQPHLYSRTQDFLEEFAAALSLYDTLYLLDIYPARELPIPGVHSEVLLQKVRLEQKYLVSKDSLLLQLKAKPPEVLISLGAGDIGKMVPDIKNVLL